MKILSKLSMVLLATGMAVISSDAQERGRGKSDRGAQSRDSDSRSSSRARGPQRLSREELQKAMEERIKQYRERAGNDSRRAPQSRGSSRSRTPQRSSGTDWRKAIEERMKQAREARERAENNSRGSGNESG
ncbi:MAG: hypothetical protein MK236_08715, partial [Pedosphaera sp.]|nr:hypothetical protein [Pedosphaera sp.]